MIDAVADLLIEVDISSYWHAGTGRAGGDDVDALIEKDGHGLPLLRGRHLKGLIREAGERLVEWKADGWTDARVNILFGRKSIPAEKTDDGKLKTPGRGSSPGCIHFGDARLPKPIVDAVRDKTEMASQLVRRLASTQIEFETGAAKNKSLRSIEAAIPLKLFTRLRWDPSDRRSLQILQDEERVELINVEAEHWQTAIKDCLPYVLSVGANRNRGFGRTKLSAIEA